MWSRVVSVTYILRNHVQQRRCMATLKSISMRLKTVKNIKKITQSMKLVSAAKYSKAERELKLQARPYAQGTLTFYESMKMEMPKDVQTLYLAISSDRGLCGGCHSSVARIIRNEIVEKKSETTAKIICVGDKVKSILQRMYAENIVMVASEIGRRPVTFIDASRLACAILNCGHKYNTLKIYYNLFKSVVSYETTEMKFFTIDHVLINPRIYIYDSLEYDILQNHMEFSLASILFFTFKEAACSEQSARMTAMDNSSKNAADIIEKLTILFNRTRQSVITKELIEIISGAAALEKEN